MFDNESYWNAFGDQIVGLSCILLRTRSLSRNLQKAVIQSDTSYTEFKHWLCVHYTYRLC